MSQYPQLDEAFKNLISQGVPIEKIRADALVIGWHDEEISAALKTVGAIFPADSMPLAPSRAKESKSQVTEYTQKSPRGVLQKLLVIIVIVVVLCAIGVVAVLGYMSGFNPFAGAPYAESTFSAELLANLGKIQSGETKVQVSAYTMSRDSGAKPFNVSRLDREELKARYKRDYERIRIVSDFRFALQGSSYLSDLKEQNSFPESMEKLRSQQAPNSSVAIRGFKPDPLTNQQFLYRQTENGSNYELTVVFETEDAIKAIEVANSDSPYSPNIPLLQTDSKSPKDSIVVDGKKVTFTKDSAQYAYFLSEPPKTFSEQLNDFMLVLADNFAFSGELIGLKERANSENDDISGSVQFDVQGDFDDLTYHVNAELRTIDGAFYFIINNLPGIFSGLVPKEQWIEWKPGEKTDFSLVDMNKIVEKYNTAEESYNRYKENVVRIADETSLIAFKQKPKRELVDGKWLYKYDLSLRKEAVVPFYASLLKVVQEDDSFKEFAPYMTEANLQSLQSSVFEEAFDYYVENTSLTIWVTQQGVPAKVHYTMRAVPPDENSKMKDKQVMIEFMLQFNRVNEDIKIVIPENSKPFDEAMEGTLLSGSLGQARIKGADAAIQSMVNNARAQFEISGSQSDGSVDYTGLCSEQNILKLLQGIEEKSEKPYCHSAATTWVLAAPLKSEGHVCVDSTGFSKIFDGDIITTGDICP